MKVRNFKKELILILLTPFVLSSCVNFNNLLVKNPQLPANASNDFDPAGGGVIDPRNISQPKITLENGKGIIIFNKGDSNLALNISLKPPANAPNPVPPLTGLKIIQNELYIDGVRLPINIESDKITKDLNYSIQLAGLSQNSVVVLKTTVIDKNDQIMASKEFQKNIILKSDNYQFDIQIDKWW